MRARLVTLANDINWHCKTLRRSAQPVGSEKTGKLLHFRGDRNYGKVISTFDRLCGLVVRVSGYRYKVSGSIPGATIFSE